MLCALTAVGCRFTLLSHGLVEPDSIADRDAASLAATDGQSAAKPSPTTIPIELVFVRFGEQDLQLRDDLWGFVDEQVIDAALRRTLAANGMRAGVVTSQLPGTFADRFRPKQPAIHTGEIPDGSFERPAVVRRILKLLPGRNSEVVAASVLTELVLLEHDGEGVHGGTYHDASTHFSLRAWPAADGRVRIDLVPTIKHGPQERSWVGEDGVFRLESGQRKHVVEQLQFHTTIPLDSMLIVGSYGDAASTVGDAFFRDRMHGQSDLRLLAIRPLSRGVDPLFEQPTVAETADR